jgi:hypothetical protein
MMENREILMALSLVVIASGCAHTASTGDTATSASVTISNFSAFPSTVIAGESSRLAMTLVNDGDSTATEVQARIFNVPFESDTDSGQNEWEITNGDRVIDFNTLEPADPEANLPARERTREWAMEAPDLQEGVTIPYQFISRVAYKYDTRGTSRITLMSQDRYREEGAGSRPVLDTTSGPVQMEVRTRSPIVFYPGEERQTEMCIIVRNQGSGTPFHPDADNFDLSDDETNVVTVTVPDQGSIDFSPAESEEVVGDQTVRVELFGNRGIGCFNINVDNWNAGVGPQTETPITATAEYGYYKETRSTVTVEGSDRFGGGDNPGTQTDDGDDDVEEAEEAPGVSG